MDTTLGTCSICGGAVTIPATWYGVVPPIPSCRSCGAMPKRPHGPVIDMESPLSGVRIVRGPEITITGANPSGACEP